MTTRDTLLQLADRCEREKPSRILDGEVMFSLFAKPVAGRTPTRHYVWPEDNSSWSFAIRFPGWTAERIASNRKGQETIVIWRDGDPILLNDLRIKPVTSSLDAAVTLVPDDHWWFMSSDKNATVFNGNTEGVTHEGEAATVALALCAAALRARAAMEAP